MVMSRARSVTQSTTRFSGASHSSDIPFYFHVLNAPAAEAKCGWAHPSHICTATFLARCPHLHRDWASA